MTTEKKTVYLVSCVAKKEAKAHQAKNLYMSPWFKLAREHVERKEAPWYILSAGLGLVHPSEYIDPYEFSMAQMTKLDRINWANNMAYRVKYLYPPDTHRLVILAGQKYREYLVAELIMYGFDVEIPMEGMGIGEQLHWLKHN